jgi:hypothetical protein
VSRDEPYNLIAGDTFMHLKHCRVEVLFSKVLYPAFNQSNITVFERKSSRASGTCYSSVRDSGTGMWRLVVELLASLGMQHV